MIVGDDVVVEINISPRDECNVFFGQNFDRTLGFVAFSGLPLTGKLKFPLR